MDYGCIASSTSSLLYAKPAFSHYGYTSNLWQYFTSAAVETSLLSGYPVFIRGSSNGGGAHAWVIDGQAMGDYYYFHMNWGWNGTSNGYFNCGTWGGSLPSSVTAGGYTFVFSTFQILTNIH
jgi:hypothetical protein